MTDTIQTVKSNAKKLMKMAAADLADQVQFFKASKKVSAKEWKPDATGHSPGDTISIRINSQGTVQEDNFDISAGYGGIKERSVDMALDISATDSFDLTSNQLAHDVDLGQVYERFIQPRIRDMAANLDHRFTKLATQYTANLVGSPGSTIVDPDTVLAGREMLGKHLAPKKGNERFFLMDSTAMRSAVNANKNLMVFKRKEFDDGYIGDALGFSWLENELLYQHTNGNDITGLAVEASVVAISEGMTTLGIDGLTNSTGTFTKGTTFTIDGVYAVHPQTKVAFPFLKRFVHVGDDVTANGSGQVTLTLSEPIYGPSSGSLQNVSALPVDEESLTIDGLADSTHTQSLMFHKEAFRVVSVPLAMPTNAEFAEQASESGMNVGIIRYFNGDKRKWITRLDFLGGFAAPRPYWSVRMPN